MRKITRRKIVWGALGVLGVLMLGGFTVLDTTLPQMRTILLPTTSIASPLDHELGQDTTKNQPVISVGGQWKSLVFGSPADLISHFPDYYVQPSSIEIPAATEVRLLSGAVLEHQTNLSIPIGGPDVGPSTTPGSQQLGWNALFAIPGTNGEYTVVSSINFSQPDTASSSVISSLQYRYLGSYFVTTVQDIPSTCVGNPTAPGCQGPFPMVRVGMGMIKTHEVYTYSLPAQSTINGSAVTFTNFPPSAVIGNLYLAAAAGSQVTGPRGEVLAQGLSTSGAGVFNASMAAVPRESNGITVNGQVSQATILGHVENPAWFVN